MLALLLRLADPHGNVNYPNVEVSDLPKVGGGVGRDEWVKAMEAGAVGFSHGGRYYCYSTRRSEGPLKSLRHFIVGQLLNDA
ncbi:hypothetical protein HDU98_009765, partial [Podochytrium sp. JEL0797]